MQEKRVAMWGRDCQSCSSGAALALGDADGAVVVSLGGAAAPVLELQLH